MIEQLCVCMENLLEPTSEEGTEDVNDSDRIAKLRSAVAKSITQFEFYADQHDRKNTEDSAVKAKVNRDLAAELRGILEETKGPNT